MQGLPHTSPSEDGAIELIQRTLLECRSRGWHAPSEGITEQFIRSRGGRPTTRDFLGIIDVIVFPTYGSAQTNACMGLQVTSCSNHAARVRKAMINDHLIYWLKACNEFQVWSWRQDKSGRWILRQQMLMLDENLTMIATKAITREPESPAAAPAGG